MRLILHLIYLTLHLSLIIIQYFLNFIHLIKNLAFLFNLVQIRPFFLSFHFALFLMFKLYFLKYLFYLIIHLFRPLSSPQNISYCFLIYYGALVQNPSLNAIFFIHAIMHVLFIIIIVNNNSNFALIIRFCHLYHF